MIWQRLACKPAETHTRFPKNASRVLVRSSAWQRRVPRNRTKSIVISRSFFTVVFLSLVKYECSDNRIPAFPHLLHETIPNKGRRPTLTDTSSRCIRLRLALQFFLLHETISNKGRRPTLTKEFRLKGRIILVNEPADISQPAHDGFCL